MKAYLDYVNKECGDKYHQPDLVEQDDGSFKKKQYYAYDTPLGMHRAKCDYCACANGQALQAFSAEGALLALAAALKEATIGSLKGKILVPLFIHDEICGSVLNDGHAHEYIAQVQEIMEIEFARITPNVKVSTEAALMFRWNKYAEPVLNESGNLIPWEPKED
jgi:hypothetical protein